MTQEYTLVSSRVSACLKPGASKTPRLRPAKPGDTAANTRIISGSLLVYFASPFPRLFWGNSSRQRWECNSSVFRGWSLLCVSVPLWFPFFTHYESRITSLASLWSFSSLPPFCVIGPLFISSSFELSHSSFHRWFPGTYTNFPPSRRIFLRVTRYCVPLQNPSTLNH